MICNNCGNIIVMAAILNSNFKFISLSDNDLVILTTKYYGNIKTQQLKRNKVMGITRTTIMLP